MARRAFLGIDCGTQSTKALLLDADTLVPLALGRAPHELIARDDGTREQHPDWWIGALQAAVRQALDGLGPGTVEVAGIGVSGQQHGMVCLDAEDRPVRPAKLWNDTTTEPDCAWLSRKLGGLDAVLALTGNPFLPGYTAPKVSWFHRSEPEAYAQTARICLPHDYLNLWLTGEFAAEPGDASGTGYFDVRARTYQPEVLTLLDADRDWARTLPPIVPSLSQVGSAAVGCRRGARPAGRHAGQRGRRRQHVRGDRRRRHAARTGRRQPGHLRDGVRLQRPPGRRSTGRGGGVLRLDRRLAAADLHARLHRRQRVGARPVRARPRRRRAGAGRH